MFGKNENIADMERVLAAECPKYLGKEVLFKGWIAQIRRLGGITFLVLRDRSGIIQGILENPKGVELQKESCVAVKGKVKEEKQAPGGYEILVKELEVISGAVELPFEVGRRWELLNIGLDTILDYRPLSLRNPVIGGIFRVQAEIVRSFREFLRKKDFLEVHTSKIISQATEGGSSLFPIEYFERKAFLAQSPQFYKQMLVGGGYERVYEVGFVYRAEDHSTSRHLNEYLSLDLEMGFIEDENDVIDLEIEFIKYLFSTLKESPHLLSPFEVVLPEIKEIPRIEYTEAKRIVKAERMDTDLTPEEERLLSQYGKERYGSDFLFITKFPSHLRPFYTMPDEKEGLSRSFDLLYKGLEITTGSQRIHDYHLLIGNMKKFGLAPEDFSFYLEIFKYGMPPHGGLAIGAERLTCQLLGLKNIREASLFPRDRKRLKP